MRSLLHWAPRILALVFTVWIASFALDVFGEHSGFRLAEALGMHLLPAAVLLAASLLGWRWSAAGTAAFLLLAAAYVGLVGFARPWGWYAFVSGPALLVGLLFLADWLVDRFSVHAGPAPGESPPDRRSRD